MQNEFMQLPEALELCDFASLGDELGSNDSGDDDGHLEKKARVGSAAGIVGEESLSAAEKAERRCAQPLARAPTAAGAARLGPRARPDSPPRAGRRAQEEARALSLRPLQCMNHDRHAIVAAPARRRGGVWISHRSMRLRVS